MLNQIHFDLEKLKKDFSNEQNITEILGLKSIVLRKRDMLLSESNEYMQQKFKVLKSLERNMFHQEMKLMGEIVIRSYGQYLGGYYHHYPTQDKIIKNGGKNLCLTSTHGLHLTLSSLNE